MKDPITWQDQDTYRDALRALDTRGVHYMLGGAIAVYYYTGWWRATHDLDVYTLKDSVPEAAAALDGAGFRDIGEQADGDREWIYHAAKKDVVIDVIWRSANLSDFVTPSWFARAPRGEFLGIKTAFLPLEELMWIKAYVINRHRCDWPDLMRVVRSQCSNVDWDYLLELLEDDWLLMAGLIDVFDWLYPGSVGCIPTEIRQEFAKRRGRYLANPPVAEREHLLDPWLKLRADWQ